MQRQLHQHALVEIAHAGYEDRLAGQAAVGHDFRNVLVRQAQCIQFVRSRAAGLVGLDHLAAATAVAAHRRQRHRVVGGQHAGIHQRAQQGDGAGGIAAGVGHALGFADGLGLLGVQLRKAVDPVRVHAVCGGGIDDARLAAGQGVDQRHRLARGIVVQAQDHHVHFAHQLLLGGGILAQCRVDADDLDAGHSGQAFADLQAGGSGLAVDENFVHGHRVFL